MSESRDVFKKREYACPNNHKFSDMRWASQGLPICEECGEGAFLHLDTRGVAPAVHGDEIDIVIRHGLTEADGSPKRFRSMTDLRREASSRGLTISGETPKMNSEYAERRERADSAYGFTYKR